MGNGQHSRSAARAQGTAFCSCLVIHVGTDHVLAGVYVCASNTQHRCAAALHTVCGSRCSSVGAIIREEIFDVQGTQGKGALNERACNGTKLTIPVSREKFGSHFRHERDGV